MSNKKGFTMVELLVVLIIVGILAAVATPLFLANTQKAKASEAVGTLSLIRQSLRDYHINKQTYFNITSGNIDAPLPTTVDSNNDPDPISSGVAVDTEVAQYFSNSAFTVSAPTSTVSASFTNGTPAVGFIVKADGSASTQCPTSGTPSDCALNANDVSNYELEMDNTGRIFVTYDGTNWSAY